MIRKKYIAFDADDTLWVNEDYFLEAEMKYVSLMAPYVVELIAKKALERCQIENLPLYGYGIKGYILSMVQSAIEISEGRVSSNVIKEFLGIGEKMLNKPVRLLDDVESVLRHLHMDYELLLITKGDLLDQQVKINNSGLKDLFLYTQILSDKRPSDYLFFFESIKINPRDVLMVGNSLKSDVLPMVEIGASAIHIPFHTTWTYEKVSGADKNTYKELNSISEILPLLAN